MCKLLGSSKLAVRRQSQIVELTRFSAETLGKSQRDGFGFALSHDKGIYGEKYTNPETCKGMGIISRDLAVIPKGMKLSVQEGRDFLVFGDFPKTDALTGSYISHGRTATCGREVFNSHPFTGLDRNGGKWTIAHNGVVESIGEKHDLQTTCDSEHILNCFLFEKGVHSLKASISGYAAILGIDPKGRMFAFRDSTAPLYCSYIEDLAICTLSTDPLDCVQFNKMVCKHNKVKATSITSAYMLEPYLLYIFNNDGTVETQGFEPFDKYTYSASAVSRSMGSAGVPGFKGLTGKNPYPSSYGYADYDEFDYNAPSYDPYEKSRPVIPAKAGETGIDETEDFLDDPAIIEQVISGELTIKGLADICGEVPNVAETEYLQNIVSNEAKKLGIKPKKGDSGNK